MIYLDIIFKTLINIFLFKEILISIFFYLFIYFIYLTWKNLKISSSKYRFLIIILRIVILFLLIPLLNKENFKFNKLINKKQNIGVVVDNSLSIKSILDNNKSLKIDNLIEVIRNWASNDINLFWYNLDSAINTNDLIYNKSNTSYENLNKFSINDDLDQIFSYHHIYI